MFIVIFEYDGFERLFLCRQIVDEDGFVDRYQVVFFLFFIVLVVGCFEEVFDFMM